MVCPGEAIFRTMTLRFDRLDLVHISICLRRGVGNHEERGRHVVCGPRIEYEGRARWMRQKMLEWVDRGRCVLEKAGC